jgi:YHS domain-containing protein
MAQAGLAQMPPKLALGGLDPVALADGREMAGAENLELVHGRFRYRFATPENKMLFEANPEERAIQFGGACGRMGPLSGTGDPSRFFVHQRRLYIFASEGCRDGFKRDPDKHIDTPNAVPAGTPDQLAQGAKLLAKILDAFGGARHVDDLKNIETTTKLIYRRGDQEIIGIHRERILFPDRIRVEDDFGSTYGHVVTSRDGFQFAPNESTVLGPAVRAFAWRKALRDPLTLLRNRHAKGFTAIARSEEQLDGRPVALLDVALDGATSTWSIDPATGRILRVAFVAQLTTIGENVHRFDDFRNVDGMILPYRRTDSFNGKPITSPERRVDRIAINADVRPEMFVQPK